MQDLVQGWAVRGFADFPGVAIDGSIPLKQELVNQLIAAFLAASQKTTSEAPGLPAHLGPVLVKMIKTLEVQATEGVITVRVAVRS